MRLPDDLFRGAAALALSAVLAGCGSAGGGDRPAAEAGSPLAAQPTGPAADYPMVLGDPFTIDGVEYVPTDVMNYDEVGYLAADDAGAGVTAAHKTLPLPSYVEVTSLETGRTILARVERRGPMSTKRLVALSPDALTQLGASEGAPVRVRRVNPPEVQRADLRAGRTAPLRMDTPETLLGVLRRNLPKEGSASLADGHKPPVPSGVQVVSESAASRLTEPVAAPVAQSGATAHPLPPLNEAIAAQPATPAGRFVVQAAAFSRKENADRAAGALGGFVSKAGRFYRVRMGPYTTRGQAEAALAKVRAAGYSDARVSTAG
ncbi:SPOR domain-containing protein [Pelagerythrobacter aerophilus]|uniref:Sporulation protein SsgA n=1 Tax=Pelagerythrobacter aerophilus TaxID=2306995 RepID=A0A418NJ83_9SPHN|nr:SPOR domain-containing protein [Pelagerythrobacter aerophilus]RIV79365.1 sporulation protein SsgA [Pelagerythrobacter aerophilus]